MKVKVLEVKASTLGEVWNDLTPLQRHYFIAKWPKAFDEPFDLMVLMLRDIKSLIEAYSKTETNRIEFKGKKYASQAIFFTLERKLGVTYEST